MTRAGSARAGSARAGSAAKTVFVRATAGAPGAIGIIQLAGDVEPLLTSLSGRADWPVGRLRLVDLGGVDEGLAGRIAEQVAELMPHGGPRVMQRLVERLRALGADEVAWDEMDPPVLYPEARDRYEALMLATLARAASPLAIDLLLDQPRRWREFAAEIDRDRGARLDRLVDPPIVVLAGPSNVGKSTLSNTLLGRSMSIALDRPGTTRDYTAGLIDLCSLVVAWHDTPGLRDPVDAIEEKAMAIARGLFERATLLIAMTDADHDWPELLCPPGLRVASKCDLARRGDADLSVSAVTGEGREQLARTVRDRLVPPEDLADPGAWRFDERL